MTKEELRTGMIISVQSTGMFYVVTEIDDVTVTLLSLSTKSPVVLPITMVEDFFVVYDKLYFRNDTEPASVYVVTTIIQEGMEFEGDDYCGVFKSLDKAKKYFESEKKEWFNKLVKRYDSNGDKVTTYNVDAHTCEVYAGDDYQDCITISIHERKVQ